MKKKIEKNQAGSNDLPGGDGDKEDLNASQAKPIKLFAAKGAPGNNRKKLEHNQIDPKRRAKNSKREVSEIDELFGQLKSTQKSTPEKEVGHASEWMDGEQSRTIDHLIKQ